MWRARANPSRSNPVERSSQAERLCALALTDRIQILGVLRQACEALGENMVCLWLVGSASQAALSPESDFDFLAVLRKDRLS